ncbi:hypothetical protein T08_2461 [Trichinella sp. T8]|nr:hypothetical protein T08_2461 [Trichinella sp. T8]
MGKNHCNNELLAAELLVIDVSKKLTAVNRLEWDTLNCTCGEFIHSVRSSAPGLRPKEANILRFLVDPNCIKLPELPQDLESNGSQEPSSADHQSEKGLNGRRIIVTSSYIFGPAYGRCSELQGRRALTTGLYYQVGPLPVAVELLSSWHGQPHAVVQAEARLICMAVVQALLSTTLRFHVVPDKLMHTVDALSGHPGVIRQSLGFLLRWVPNLHVQKQLQLSPEDGDRRRQPRALMNAAVVRQHVVPLARIHIDHDGQHVEERPFPCG